MATVNVNEHLLNADIIYNDVTVAVEFGIKEFIFDFEYILDANDFVKATFEKFISDYSMKWFRESIKVINASRSTKQIIVNLIARST